MRSVKYCAQPACIVLFLSLFGCAGTPDGAPDKSAGIPPDAVPRDEPKSRYGNGPYYEVYGVTYEVMDSGYGYRERGVASWYGKKFHGRPTSSQEPYDMYKMTAAHKTLPLPTYVEVRNLSNNRRVIVRVNDRGPFVDNRLIDLSYAAATKLDLVTPGTGLVEIRALSGNDPEVSHERQVSRSEAEPASRDSEIFVQVGAYGDRDNAKRRYDMLRDRGIRKVVVHKDEATSPSLYRIRIGPVADVAQYDSIVQRLENIGISESHLVTE